MSVSEQNANIRFVQEVQKYPTLYNYELPSYTRRDMSEEAWSNVGKTMNMTPSACRERWRNLRAVFMRTMKAAPNSTGKKKPYYMSEVMQFVVPFLRPGKNADVQSKLAKDHVENSKSVEIQEFKIEVPDDDSYDSYEQSAEEETEKEILVSKKRLVQDEEPQQTMKAARIAQPASSSSMPPDSDHVRSFLDSLLPELTEMNSAQFKHFKRRVLLLIDNIVTEIPATPRRPTDDEYIM